ncbi:MAG: nucleoside diphosphate kinase regulator [Thermoanaerobaculia bacterium]
MPVIFAASGAQALPGMAAGIVVLTARRFDRRHVAATLGAHIMSPTWLPSATLEERVAAVLRGIGVEVPLSQRVPSTVPLPSGFTGNVPVVVLTVNAALGLDRLQAVGGALRQLRDEGVVLAGIMDDDAGASQGGEMLATVSLLLGAACEDPIDDDDGCCFWNVEAAGELPSEVLQQLRPFLLPGEPGENQHDMARKKAPAIHVTRFDKTRLMRLLRNLDAAYENRDEIAGLERELERGIEVDSTEVGPDVVTMNSTVRVTDLDTNTSHLYTIVFPGDADFEKGRISILSPLGTALLGYRAGDEVTWEMPLGMRRLRIEELVYQPEAAGDFHL